MKSLKIGITLTASIIFSVANATSPELPTKILAIGDSHTAPVFLGDSPLRFSWPEHLQKRIGDETGITPEINNTGVSGDSTANMLRDLKLLNLEIYDSAIIYGGANDTNAPRDVLSLENGTRLTLVVPDANGLGNNRYEAGTHVVIQNTATGQTYTRHLTGVGGQPTTRLFLSESIPTIDNFGDYAITIDTAKNLSHMSRILRANGVNRIMIVGAHIRAFSPNGESFDCLSQEVDELAIQARTREAQKQAAENSGARFVDTLDQNLGLICNENPTPPELVSNPESLHRTNGEGIPDSHLTVEGRRLFLADPIFSAMRQEGWL